MPTLPYFYLLLLLASLSYTASQITIFLINKVTGWRLLFGICYSIFVFVLQLALWAVSIHTLAFMLFQINLPPNDYITIFEPILFIFLWSIFTILPFIGRGISTLILLLALLSAMQGIMRITDLTLWQAFTCTFGGWVILTILHVFFEKALIRKANPFWTLATGRSKKLTSSDIQNQLQVLNDEIIEFIKKITVRKYMIGILLDNLFFLGYICTGALATVVLLFAFLAPFESLLWWKDLKFAPARFVKRLQKFECKEKNTDADFFIVYLSGVGVISGDGLAADEQHFVDRLQHHFPHAAIVTDVFPYSAESDSLSSDRFFPKLWKYLEKNRLTNKKNVLDFLILLRNALQLAVATDDRYAPIYNLGTTTLILQGLLKKGYDLRDQKPICLIGYSGGAQIAVGAATYLHEIIHAPISMITIGGAINDDPGLNAITHLDYLYSPKDPVVMSMPWLFSGRMPFNVFSLWNQSVREGKITYTNVGNCSHAYAYSYFDTLHTLPDTHHTYAQKPLQTTVELLETTIPVNSFTTAVKKIRAMMHEEKALVDPKHNSILLTHGKKTHDVLTIFHGYTNSPPQFLRLALSFYEKGFTVYIPRLPEHGYKEKYYKRTDEMTATKLVDATNKFLDISQQLGDQVHVMGLSLGGVLATYAAQYRNITSAFIIAPSLRIYGINNGWLQLLRFFPGIFIPWTLSAYNKTIATSYSHFSVKGMGESLYLANGILADAKRHTPKAREVTFLLNAQDKAISNDAVHQLQKEWEHHEFSNTTIFTIPKGIVNTHDIISPLEKGENINYVYPLILDLFFKENKKEKIRQ